MPVLSHQASPIETFMPSVDHRNAGRSFVVDGRNFLFGPKGPYSGFTSRILSPFPFGVPEKAQGITIQDRTLVFTGDSILAWRTKVPFTWELLYAFDSPLPANLDGPWTAMYIDNQLWLSQPGRGMFVSELDPSSNKLWLHQVTAFDIPGLESFIRGMDVVHSRAVMVNDNVIQWSAVGSMANLTPALGGAGFQNLDAFVQGTFLGLNSFQDGFVVWTTGGAVIGEYIGGDEVWSFYPLKTQFKPVGRRAVARKKDGNIIFLDSQGLMQSNNSANVGPYSEEFNEYFLTTMFPEDGQLTPNQFWRLDYDASRESIYLSESADGAIFWRTFVFNPTRNKWGLFSDKHYGMLPLTPDTFGHVDLTGIAHYFLPTYTREAEPDNARGLNRIMPALQKQGYTMSSTVTCRTAEFDPSLPMEPYDPPQAGWYDGVTQVPKAGDPASLDSWIEIGYVRPQELQGWVNQTVEIQELKISSPPSEPQFIEDYRTSHHASWFYPEFEEWNSIATIQYFDTTEDFELTDDSEDWLTGPVSESEDWLYAIFPLVTYDPVEYEDWDTAPDSTEDWNGPGPGLIPIDYGIEVKASQDGITFDATIPEMSRFNVTAQDWATISSGLYHRIRLSAAEPWQYYDASLVSVTLQFSGNIG